MSSLRHWYIINGVVMLNPAAVNGGHVEHVLRPVLTSYLFSDIAYHLDLVLSASQSPGSGTPCFSTFVNRSPFLLLNVIWKHFFSVSLPHPLATHSPTRHDSFIDFDATQVFYLLTYLLTYLITYLLIYLSEVLENKVNLCTWNKRLLKCGQETSYRLY